MNPASVVCKSIELGGQVISLTARTLQKYICEWHLDSFARAVFLGTPVKAIKTIAAKLDLKEEQIDAAGIVKGIDDKILKVIPPLEILTTDCNVAITDCVINNVSGSQRFGIGLPIDSNNRIGPVTIDGVALQIKFIPDTTGQDTADRS